MKLCFTMVSKIWFTTKVIHDEFKIPINSFARTCTGMKSNDNRSRENNDFAAVKLTLSHLYLLQNRQTQY